MTFFLAESCPHKKYHANDWSAQTIDFIHYDS